ncbi:MAG: Lar family restriction alleviation protein [Methylobacterium sp.]|nr:Lar family restriction alleviation protein [Methylobacterium sp.]
MADELKPCPFCGSTDVATSHIRDGRVAKCLRCGATGSPQFHGPASELTRDDRAIAAWNTRPAPAPVEPSEAEQAEVEAVWAAILDAFQSGEHGHGVARAAIAALRAAKEKDNG